MAVEKREICAICYRGELTLVVAEKKLYRCKNCNFYYGDFLHTKKVIYYNTTHLKIGECIAVENQLVGRCGVYVNNEDRDSAENKLADKIYTIVSHKGDAAEILDGLRYLIECGVLHTYFSRIGGDLFFGVNFKQDSVLQV